MNKMGWSDAKKHISGELDLKVATKQRSLDSKNRFRLYPLLADGFLLWWNEKSKWSNEGYLLAPTKLSGQYSVPGGGIIKVENFICLKRGDSKTRFVYPYFSEKPILHDDNARLGLWVISQAVPDQPLKDLRILDVLRGKPYSSNEIKFSGIEEAEFLNKYAILKTIDNSLAK